MHRATGTCEEQDKQTPAYCEAHLQTALGDALRGALTGGLGGDGNYLRADDVTLGVGSVIVNV